MINISDEVKVGVNILGLCDYYSNLLEYSKSLEYRLEHTLYQLNHTDYYLMRLNVYEKDNHIIEEYYISETDDIDNVIQVICKTNIKNHKLECFYDFTNDINIDFKYTLDINYFINNN